MTSYQTVQIVAYSAAPLSTDYIALAPGYTLSDGSVAPAGGGAPPGSGNSLFWTSAISAQVTGSNVTLDLPAVVAAGSYTSVTVDKYGRVTVGANPAASSGTSLTATSAFSTQVTAFNLTLDLPATVAAGSYVTVSVDQYGRVTGGQTSLSTVFVTGTWTSGVSSNNVQGLGSTWTVSRLSSDKSILGVDIWASTISAATYVGLPAGGGSGNSLFFASAISATVSGANVTLDLMATGVTAASSYNSITVDDRGRVTAAQTVAAGGGPTYSFTSLSAATGYAALALHDSAMSFTLTSGKLYRFLANYIFMTQATTTGLRMGLTCPAFTVLAAEGRIPVAAGGTGEAYTSAITASGVSITGTGVGLAGVNYLAQIDGLIQPSANGNLVFQWASEINASRVTLAAGSSVEMWQLTP